MEQRRHFIDAYMRKESSVTELCRRFGISRKTGYKWIGRFLGYSELSDRSRRPHTSPNAVARWLEDAIVDARKEHPRWGPRKLREVLLRANPGVQLPSVSTFAVIFKRNGLVRPRRRRCRAVPSTLPLKHATAPNMVWCIDFKGDFATGRSRCYPLTITDAYSRYLIACVAMPDTRTGRVRRALSKVFEEFGLPDAIRSDNGSPFASQAPQGLSELSAWWLKLGIRHERIEPGKPQQNGRHERMHLTLKQETANPPANSMRSQQRAFDRFRHEYNDERPHEALRNRVPADFYEPSKRVLPEPEWGPDFSYPETYETTRIGASGTLLWNGRSAFISTVLAHELVGLRWRERRWDVFFGPLRLGALWRGRRFRFTRSDQRR